MANSKFKPVRSQLEGFQRAIRVWVCKNCERWHYEEKKQHRECAKCGTQYAGKIKQCYKCGGSKFKSSKPVKCEQCDFNDFHFFRSKTEGNRYAALRLLEKHKKIKNLRCGVTIPLTVNGHKCGKYIADFMYHNPDNKLIVEDTKFGKEGETQLYKFKIQVVYALYKIEVKSIYGE